MVGLAPASAAAGWGMMFVSVLGIAFFSTSSCRLGEVDVGTDESFAESVWL